MDQRSDLKSILPFLPLVLRESSLAWPERAEECLKALSLDPTVSHVDKGGVLFDFILDLRDSLGFFSDPPLSPLAFDGFSLFFDEYMSRMDARVWFQEVVPELAKLLLRFPSILELNYNKSDQIFAEKSAGLRILSSQDSGIVYLSQELISALLACGLFCLFPTRHRESMHLPIINFDHLFALLPDSSKQSQENKVRCLIHYFERICKKIPNGFVSFERRVLNKQRGLYPDFDFWKSSTASLCPFKVINSGYIEDQENEAIEVDFANEYLGGGALAKGCVQEEIRFMINPELIAGMLFMPCMKENEAIEIIGVERFSQYMGYGSTFRFVGDYTDNKPFDSIGRKKTRIVAIDALYSPRMKQYETKCILREANKAFCGFLDQSIYQTNPRNSQESCKSCDNSEKASSSNSELTENKDEEYESMDIDKSKGIGIATGNWGCGAFGGDPQIKSMIQWIAASQAFRPFIHYYTFEELSLERLEEVTRWIQDQGWTVGDLWQMLIEYSSQRVKRETKIGFFSWLVPEKCSTTDTQNMSQ